MSRTDFSETAIARAAQRLGVESATVRAAAEVESNGSGFLPDGRPKILFERHIFSRLTNRKHDQAHPDLSNPDPGNYDGGAAEYSRLYRALQLDGEAAVLACSWGAFQIMGFNWPACGEKSREGFLLAMHHDMDAHLSLFVAYVSGQKLGQYLQRQDWKGFAERYNGPASTDQKSGRNRYAEKLAAAYARHKASA